MADEPPLPTRRALLKMIGLTAGSGTMLNAMASLGHARQSPYTGPPDLSGAPDGQSVVVLGGGLAGMCAALELRRAGYDVTILEYQNRAGGRCWTLKGGDQIEELGGYRQDVEFSDGQYINIGPWRIPHHHLAVLDYCHRLDVPLEVFVQENHNAYLHSANHFDGKPIRYGHAWADYVGQITELLGKATNKGALDSNLTQEDTEILLESLKSFGILDKDYRYTASLDIAEYRGYPDGSAPGGGLYDAAPEPSEPIALKDLLQSRFWQYMRNHTTYRHHAPMFQPVGGMEQIAKAFEREVGDLIQYNAQVTRVMQSEDSVTVEYNAADGQGEGGQITADYCVCTIPFTILSQLDVDVSPELRQVMRALHYYEAVKAGLEFKRRFWERDEQIYGGITLTDLPIAEIAYPSNEMHSSGPGVLLGAYVYGPHAYAYNSMSPEERLESVLEYGAQIHPQYRDEFTTGVVLSWHRVPWMLGCYSNWDERGRDYEVAATMDNRFVCAGEHISYLPGWQEGSLLSALDAVRQIHERATTSQ
ncbi:flavin monoamine oxidase family protein [Marivita sp.]|uniref:flavin monoamine oxidase family protein n=1 Tax=Marivita sp. TaxID=2003365 RepID=UPI0025BBE1FA|nr:flavin monoamine oxidase family protein [Marivita sp.]